MPNHHADDIGPMLGVPSSLVVEMRTTGVPQYRIAGEMGVWRDIALVFSLKLGSGFEAGC